MHRDVAPLSRGIFRHSQIANRMDIHRDGLCQCAHLCAVFGCGRQEPERPGFIKVFEDRERLGHHGSVDVDCGHERLGIAGQMGGGLLVARDQINRHAGPVFASHIESDADPIARA